MNPVKAFALKLEANEGAIENAGPERALLTAILWSALVDIKGDGFCAESGWLERSAKQKWAISWIMSDSLHCSQKRGVSFLFICEILDFDAKQLRKSVASYIPAYVARSSIGQCL